MASLKLNVPHSSGPNAMEEGNIEDRDQTRREGAEGGSLMTVIIGIAVTLTTLGSPSTH